MIKEVIMYTVICDNCNKDANEGSDYSCWDDKGIAVESAIESDWIEVEDKHYCQDCVSYDDDDNLVLKIVLNNVNLKIN